VETLVKDDIVEDLEAFKVYANEKRGNMRCDI
jgi:hypothetical protein